jgi:AAT family amino acid transporter
MSTISEAGTADVRDVPDKRTLPWWAFGLANLAVVSVLSVGAWWLLVDPQWSVLDSYPQPYTAVLFWTIISVVWVAFNFGWLGPARLAQPARGLVGIGVTLALGVGITVLLGYGYGLVDASFAAGRAGGAGFTTGNLVVLFAFFFYVTAVVNWGQWPWSGGTAQPLTGLGEVALLAIPTVAVYALLALPNLATWGDPASALFTVPTLVGWFYSLIVAVVLTGLLTENWPWRLAGSPGRVVALSVIGNVALGTGLYYVLLAVAKALMGGANAAALEAGVTIHAAELGVCWVFWMIAWPNMFGNRPTGRGDAANFTARIAVTFGLGALTYLLYYFALAGPVLHEPQLVGAMHGDALGFVDWAVLWMLWYVLFLGSYGLPPARSDDAVAATP